MKKIILLAGLVGGGVVLSATAFANDWLLYLPAILQNDQGGTDPDPDPPVILGEMNDTGIVTGVGENGACIAGEDCNYGRDVTDNSSSDGHAGFVFSQINGIDTCVLDNVTGLAWEVKTDDDGTGDKDNTYTWEEAKTYVEGFTGCGDTYTSCRLPTVNELLSIVSYGASAAPMIDTTFFPNTFSGTYLTGTETANASSTASTDIWGVDFESGITDSAAGKDSSYRVRAVCVAPVN
jgi:hypothetical protein